MGRKRFHLVIILLGFFTLSLQASNKSEVYSCYLNNRMSYWKILIDQLNNQSGKSREFILELTNYQSGYIDWCLQNNRKEEAITYLKLAEANVKLLESTKYEPSLVNAYKAAFYGFHITLNKFSAPFLGSKSNQSARQSILLDPNQPFGYIQLGNVQFHLPSLMGGSKTEGLRCYLIAKSMMEKKKEDNRGDWNYLNLLVTIAKAYESVCDSLSAKLMYEEILKFEPEFILVKDDLYPKLLKK